MKLYTHIIFHTLSFFLKSQMRPESKLDFSSLDIHFYSSIHTMQLLVCLEALFQGYPLTVLAYSHIFHNGYTDTM